MKPWWSEVGPMSSGRSDTHRGRPQEDEAGLRGCNHKPRKPEATRSWKR
jgi:hypothetical protein